MSVRKFVSGSSVVLAAWLGATFFQEVPADRYPKLGRPQVSASADKVAPPIVGTATEKERELAVAQSR